MVELRLMYWEEIVWKLKCKCDWISRIVFGVSEIACGRCKELYQGYCPWINN